MTVSCKTFLFQKSCCSFCYGREKISYGWGHSGTVTVAEAGTLELSCIYQCAYQSGLGGHVSFDLEMGVQKFLSLNASLCQSQGEVYAYGATSLSGSFCTFAKQTASGLTLRNTEKSEVRFSHFAFIENPNVGFTISSDSFKSHSTIFDDSVFVSNTKDIVGSLITFNRCETTLAMYSGVTIGEDCDFGVSIDVFLKDEFIQIYCEKLAAIGNFQESAQNNGTQSMIVIVISILFSYN